MTLRKRLFGEQQPSSDADESSFEAGLHNLTQVADAMPSAPVLDPLAGYAGGDNGAMELTAALRRVWHKPDELHDELWEALDDGWHPALLVDAAERLRDIDPDGERSCTLYAAVLMRAGRAASAERLLSGFLDANGATPVLLLKLARAYEAQGKLGYVERTLWQAVELAPNDERVVDAWCRLHVASGSDGGEEGALERVADLLCAWRARLRLACIDAQRGRRVEALQAAAIVLETVDAHEVRDAQAAASDLVQLVWALHAAEGEPVAGGGDGEGGDVSEAVPAHRGRDAERAQIEELAEQIGQRAA